MTFRDLVWKLRGMGINLSSVGPQRAMPGYEMKYFHQKQQQLPKSLPIIALLL